MDKTRRNKKGQFVKGSVYLVQYTKEIRQRMSEKRKGFFENGGTVWNKGVTGYKQPKISKALRGKKLSKKHRAKLSRALIGNKRGLGYKHTEEARKKMSVSGKGKKFTLEHRKKISKALKGENSYNWKGGVTPKNKIIRKSMEYRLWRTAVFIRDDYVCQKCGQRGGKLQADHIKPFSKYPELRLAIDNGRTLCEGCHKQTETYGWSLYHLTK